MSTLRTFFEMSHKMLPNLYTAFMLEHGRDHQKGPDTYAGPRGKPNNCFMNATHLALDDRSLTYVEGKVSCHGVPIDHAWCVDADGVVVDPTLTDPERITGYFGVPFKTDYVMLACIRNDVYGMLDFYFARKTAPKLFELGLEAGQQWLLDGGKRKKSKK